MTEPLIVATWPFGAVAVRAGLALLEAGRPALDAAVAGARAVEDDPSVNSVGYGGLADALGVVTLDACVMDGRTLACGGVAGVQNVRHVADLARLVLEKTPHLLLVGEGARLFASEQGFPFDTLHTSASVARWEGNRPAGGGMPVEDTHDTVTVLALDRTGSLAGACSTSGLAYKRHGRVGDSPIIGAGLYADDEAGAAGGTGVGEEILRVSGSTLVVEAMRTGRSPQEACVFAIGRVNAAARRRGVSPARVAFIALDPKGRVGAACTVGARFDYAVGFEGKTELRTAEEISTGGV